MTKQLLILLILNAGMITAMFSQQDKVDIEGMLKVSNIPAMDTSPARIIVQDTIDQILKWLPSDSLRGLLTGILDRLRLIRCRI